jgi:hypothetical protein
MAPAVLILPAGNPELAPAGPLAEALRAADAAVEVRLCEPPGPRPAAGRPVGAVVSRIASRSAAREMPGLVTLNGAQVAVSDDPAVIRAMGRLRRAGALAVPTVALVTRPADPASQSADGVDAHLIADPAFRAAVREVAPSTRIACVRGLVDPRYEVETEAMQARKAIGVPQGSPLIVIFGGQEARGDLAGAGEVALAADPASRVVILCGANEERRRELGAWFARARRIRVVGPTGRLPELLAAADVLIDTADGLTAHEARLRGVAVIPHGRGAGEDRQVLADALIDALRRPRAYATAISGRPAAADEVLAVAGLAPLPA